MSDGLSFPLDFVFYFSIACFNPFLLSFVILLLKACLISYQYFIMKLSLLLTAFLLGGTSLKNCMLLAQRPGSPVEFKFQINTFLSKSVCIVSKTFLQGIGDSHGFALMAVIMLR